MVSRHDGLGVAYNAFDRPVVHQHVERDLACIGLAQQRVSVDVARQQVLNFEAVPCRFRRLQGSAARSLRQSPLDLLGVLRLVQTDLLRQVVRLAGPRRKPLIVIDVVTSGCPPHLISWPISQIQAELFSGEQIVDSSHVANLACV